MPVFNVSQGPLVKLTVFLLYSGPAACMLPSITTPCPGQQLIPRGNHIARQKTGCIIYAVMDEWCQRMWMRIIYVRGTGKDTRAKIQEHFERWRN